MTRKRFSEEDILRILRQIELELARSVTIETAIRTIGISDATIINGNFVEIHSI